MNVNFINQIYKDLKEHTIKNSRYSPRVTRKALKQSDKFPLITVTINNNRNILKDTTGIESTDRLDIDINIYAEDMAIGNEKISNVNIVAELGYLVDEILGRKYRMRRTSCKPTPNLDETIYRETMKYSKKMITNKNLLI